MKNFLLTLAIGCSSTLTFANENFSATYDDSRIDVIQTGRYTQIKNIPLIDQLNPLKVVIKTRIPQSVTTIGEAVDFLLVRSGFELASSNVLSQDVKKLLALPLPQVQREIGPMTLNKALQTLCGEAFSLVVDPVHRKIAYVLSSKLVRRR